VLRENWFKDGGKVGYKDGITENIVLSFTKGKRNYEHKNNEI